LRVEAARAAQLIFRTGPVRRGLNQGPAEGDSAALKALLQFNLYLRVAAPIFFSLFFVEYLPLFAIGYWSWGYAPHKILSGSSSS